MQDTSTDVASGALPAEVDLTQLSGHIARPIELQKVGIRTRAGKLEKITFTTTVKEIAERLNFDRLLARHDFDIDSTLPGNRDITESHWKEIEKYLLEDERPFIGTITVAMRHEQVDIEKLGVIGDCAELVKMTIYEGSERPILEDGQHRCRGAVGAWNQIRDFNEENATLEQLECKQRLAQASVTVEMLLEHDRNILSTLFVRMGSTKPISPNLVAVMDHSKIQNRLGATVMRKSELFRHRTTYLGAKAGREMAAERGREYEPMYPAGAVRNAAANIAGVGVRDRSPSQRESLLEAIIGERRRDGQISEDAAIEAVGTEIAAIIDYAYRTLPGWEGICESRITVNEFKTLYVHGTAAGLTTIATVLSAARLAKVSTDKVINVMARVVPWRRDALRDGPDENGHPSKLHEFFEGTLVQTELGKDGVWRAGTAGARRDLYQSAAEKVLRAVAAADKSLRPIADRNALVAVGLASAGRGRPKKAVVKT
ncbi:DNA sulfur modification protein DndB [Nocardia asteroides]